MELTRASATKTETSVTVEAIADAASRPLPSLDVGVRAATAGYAPNHLQARVDARPLKLAPKESAPHRLVEKHAPAVNRVFA